MSPHLGFWTAGIDHAILRNVIVVADALEASCLVADFQCFYREVLVNTCGTAMYHDQIDFSLILHRILWIIKMFNFPHGSHRFSVCDLEAGAALHTEGAEDGSEDGDDEVDYFLDSFLFHVN